MVNLDQLTNFSVAYVSAKILSWVAKLLNTSLSESKIFTFHVSRSTFHVNLQSRVCKLAFDIQDN